jgi:hypothetical protein
MARLLRQVPGRIVLLADTPISRYDVPACLSRNLDDIRRCATDRAYAFGSKPRARELVAARLTGATLVALSDVVCPGDGTCPAVIDGMIVYRDDHPPRGDVRGIACASPRRSPPGVRAGGGVGHTCAPELDGRPDVDEGAEHGDATGPRVRRRPGEPTFAIGVP